MGTLKEDIIAQSDWIIQAFSSLSIELDYTIDSFIEIDVFFKKYSSNGEAKKGSPLSKNLGPILFSLASYIGETIIKIAPGSIWITDDDSKDGELTISVELPGGIRIFPGQRVMKRFKNGEEDSIYAYGYEITKEFHNGDFNSNYWDRMKEQKAWWKFW